MTDQQGSTTRSRSRAKAEPEPAKADPGPAKEEPAVDLPESLIPVYRADGSVVAMVPLTEAANLPFETAGVLMVPKEQASIHVLMGRVLAELPAIGKNQVNKAQNFNFRGIDDVLNALNPLLAKYGVFYVPDVIDRVSAQRTTSRDSIMYEVNLHVRFTFYGPNGDKLTGSAWGEGTDMGDKATNKAMTQAMKAMLFQAFAISTDEQSANDPDAGAPEETVDPNAAARDMGWADRATMVEKHDQLSRALKRSTDDGLLTEADGKALKDLGFGWPMSHDDYNTYAQNAADRKAANVAAKEAQASQEASGEGSTDNAGSEVGG